MGLGSASVAPPRCSLRTAARIFRVDRGPHRRRRAKLKSTAELSLVRHDWALFLQPDRLAQKAGCAQRHLRRMVFKELVDNAADTSTEVQVEQLDSDAVRVVDRGPGLGGARV